MSLSVPNSSSAYLPQIPKDIQDYLDVLDEFIESKIKPLQAQDDNDRFFDHRRENSRTDWDNDGLPTKEWEDLLDKAKALADEAGHFRFGLPRKYGGQDGSNLAMAIIREHLAAKGLGLHNELQNEFSIVANLPQVLMIQDFGTQKQQQEIIPKLLGGELAFAFGLTEEEHGSDATWMNTVATEQDGGWLIKGKKCWTSGMHVATVAMIFARTEGERGSTKGITCFLVPVNTPGFSVKEWIWTFNMPTDHPKVDLDNVWVPKESILGPRGDGLAVAGHFLHENRIRQAAASLGAAQYCINESVKYAKLRKPFGRALSENQAIEFPLVELQTEATMLRLLIRSTAAQMDRLSKKDVSRQISDKIAMCNYRANRLACNASDQAIQTHGGIGYSRHKPFEHIYRHHRRYRITEGSDEIQMRRIGQYMFKARL